MPPVTSKSNTKRKAPTFKPPRPVSKAVKTAPPRRKSAPLKRGRRSFLDDEASASGSADQEEDDDDDEMPSDTLPQSASDEDIHSLPATTRATHAAPSQDAPPTIPPALLTKLLHHHFKDNKMRIGQEANGVVVKYMETFVREAIARAAFERSEAAAQGSSGGMTGDFLEVGHLSGHRFAENSTRFVYRMADLVVGQVEDLEKLAPQLLLDF